jgi:hypothetical protein
LAVKRLATGSGPGRCVEDGEQLAGDGDQGDQFGLSGGDEAFVEGLEERWLGLSEQARRFDKWVVCRFRPLREAAD